jgi:hypothetical protein
MSTAVITASASILVAVLAFILNQLAQLRQERRQARLSRVNSQLRDLYGPLNALVGINEQMWTLLTEAQRQSNIDRGPQWYQWRNAALMPQNFKMRSLLIEHADLLVDQEFPQVLLDFCSHVTQLEVLIANEEAVEGFESALIEHPGVPYVGYIRSNFGRLKAEQHTLLRATSRQRSRP